jgi:capsular polysaccharide biosynthesis protein
MALQRATETRMASQTNQTNISLLNPATMPTRPASKSIIIIAILALFMGSFLGLALTLVAEMLDRRVRTDNDLTDVLDLPVLVTLNSIQPQKPKRLLGLFNRQKALPN